MKKEFAIETTYTKPIVFKPLSKGGYCYKYKVTEHIDPIGDTYWTYIPIYVHNVGRVPNYKDLVIRLIRMHVTQDEEFDLINSFNAGVNKEEYTEYINLLKSIKEQVKADIEAYKNI